jgi:hypothetical protein
MNVFGEIGAALKAAWKQRDSDEAIFPELAVDALRNSRLVGTIGLQDVLAWVQTTDRLPPQTDHGFGKPITVFHDPTFFIDVLTWTDGTTAIHEHGFAGAFMVLEGSSLHSRYQFSSRRRYSEHLHLGRTELIDVELLAPGDVRPIHPGPRSAHALFHLERPSVTVVVRTHKASTAAVQLSYARSGMAVNPFEDDISTQRLLRSLEIMRELDDPSFISRARSLIDERDALTAYKIIDYLSRKVTSDELRQFLATADGPRHRDLVAALTDGFDESRREANLMARRRAIRSVPHRFFLALLLNLRGSQDILRMVATRYPDGDPVDTVMTWITELAALPPVVPGEPNAIGIDLDEVALEVMASLLRGASDDEAIDALALAYEGVDEIRADLHELCGAVRRSVFFGTLFG